jgi:acyl-coenzyme A synthetase/AMP-(fatty) acid ligase
MFLGRLDDQVKIRGYRVELGEVEAVFRAHHRADEAVAVLSSPAGDSLLMFYSGDAVPEEQARATLAELLPEYMIPARIIWLPRIPRTAHGKVDRAQLRTLSREVAGQPSPSRCEQPITHEKG